MITPKGATVVLLVAGLVAVPPLARSDEPTESGHQPMSGSVASQAGDSRPASVGEAYAASHPALRSELLAMAKKDQAVRGRINSEGETPELLEEESRIDWRNTARMKLIVDEFGWPTRSMVGKDGAKAAWLMAIHADHDTKFQRKCLDLMKAALKRDEVSTIYVAYLTDRVRTREGRPQVYGTQYGVIDGVRQYFPIEDLKHVEKRRAEVGLPPLGEYRELPKSLAITLGKPRPTPAQQGGQSEREAMYYRYLEFPSYVKGGSIEPHWMADGSSFWYAEGAPGNTVIYKVNPKVNAKTPLFDTALVRQELTTVLGHEPPYKGLPFEAFTFADDDEKAIKFTLENKDFMLQLDSYVITQTPALSQEEKKRLVPQAGDVPSPDKHWLASIKDHNIWLRSSRDDRSVALTNDGIEDYGWLVPSWGDRNWWSPNSLKLAAKKVDSRKVVKMPIVHWLQPTEEVTWDYYPIAGGTVAQIELLVVDVLSKKQVPVGAGPWPNEEIYILGWPADSSELWFVRSDREYKKFELVAANPTTGVTRVLLSETRETFVNGWDFSRTSLMTFLEHGKKFIWMSERDGWNHLYLFDINGKLIRQLTEGNFPVVEIISVDESVGWIYFTAHDDRNRPYDTHLYRVSLEGNGFERLTEAPGQHVIQMAPSKKFFLDTHSSPDRPPIVELRRADGTLLQILSRANIESLEELRWKPPEEFVVKAADKKTALYGVLYKPFDFDPDKKYPIIQVVYGGARIAQAVRRTFIPRLHDRWAYELAQLGFITFFVDPRGTAHRGKDFQDVFYGNIGSPEKTADYVATLEQLAAKRPYMDLGRVGIMGHSTGGYYALRAMLLAGDIYDVGVASAAPADGSVSPWEYYMGLPQNNKVGYELASNLPLANNLDGRLLLIVGTNDVLFSRTMKMVDALIRANKHFDFVLLPEKGHSLPRISPYWREAIRRYFQEHLKP